MWFTVSLELIIDFKMITDVIRVKYLYLIHVKKTHYIIGYNNCA